MKHLFTKTWTCFLAGVFALLPLAITVGIAVWVVNFIKGIVGPGTMIGDGLQSLGMHFETDNAIVATLIGWSIVFAAIFLLGMLVQSRAKLFTVHLLDKLFKGIPVIGSVYDTAAQFVKMLKKSDESELSGMSVVFCAFGQEHGTGLLALMPSPEKYHIGERDYHIVYIPTSPVPMTGGLLYVPAETVTRVEMSVENLMSIYLSMGVTSRQVLADQLVR